MFYIIENDGNVTVFYDLESVPSSLKDGVITVDTLPKGDGILRLSETNELYLEPFPEVTEPEVPATPVPQPETTEQKLERVLDELIIQRKHNEIAQQQNLILLDVNMTIYEELITLQERLNNA